MAIQSVIQRKQVNLGDILREKVFPCYSDVFSHREIKEKLAGLGVEFFQSELDKVLLELQNSGFLGSHCVLHKRRFFSSEEWCLMKFWKKQ